MSKTATVQSLRSIVQFDIKVSSSHWTYILTKTAAFLDLNVLVSSGYESVYGNTTK